MPAVILGLKAAVLVLGILCWITKPQQDDFEKPRPVIEAPQPTPTPVPYIENLSDGTMLLHNSDGTTMHLHDTE